jgi:hypothetical protein
MFISIVSCRRAARINKTTTSSSIINYFSYTTGVRVRACWYILLLNTRQEIIYINKAVVIITVIRGIKYYYQVPSAILDIIIIIEILIHILLLNGITFVILS